MRIFNWLLADWKNLLIGVLSSIFASLFIFVVIKSIGSLWYKFHKRKFRLFFGKDSIDDDSFRLVYAELQPTGDPTNYLFQKKVTHNIGYKSLLLFKFRADEVVSVVEMRAAKYLSESFCRILNRRPVIESDNDTFKKSDKSFISFGGANYMSIRVWKHESNKLIRPLYIDEHTFFCPVTNKDKIFRLKADSDYDYGLLLRISPPEHRGKVWIACIGIGEWGTSGSAFFLANNWKQLLKRMRKTNWKTRIGLTRDINFAAIIAIEKKDDTSAKLVEFYTTLKDIDESNKFVDRISWAESPNLQHNGTSPQ